MGADGVTSRRTAAIAVLVVAAIVLAAVAAVFLVPGPSPPEEPVDADLSATVVYGQLVALGIEDAVVDASDDRVLVRYNRDGNRSVTPAHVAVEAAEVYPDVPRIVIQVFEGFEPREQVVVETEVALALARGEVSAEAFESAANTTALG